MAELNTLRKYEIVVDDNGLISVPIDICAADSSTLNRRSFYLSTGAPGCTMRSVDLKALGYDTSVPVVLPLIRVGMFDFLNIPVEISDANILGANVLKWLNFSISNTEDSFEVDLIRRLKPIVEKGINPNMKAAYMSRLKGSEFSDNYCWHTWEEIDILFPNSWVLLLGGNDELDYGGEVVWHSEDETPDTLQEDMFLYCNKSIATRKPFVVQYEDYIRCRGFAKPDPSFYGYVEELEARLSPPVINRFYYDTVSKQGKLFMMSRSYTSTNVNPDAVLTQHAIDALFAELVWDDDDSK